MAIYRIQAITLFDVEAENHREAALKARKIRTIDVGIPPMITYVTANLATEIHSLKDWCEGCGAPLFEGDACHQTEGDYFICGDCLEEMVD